MCWASASLPPLSSRTFTTMTYSLLPPPHASPLPLISTSPRTLSLSFSNTTRLSAAWPANLSLLTPPHPPPPTLSQDSDVTQELVLRHHASVSKLKRLFMEDLPVFGPTEWDRRLSSYTPVVYPKLPNGELFTGIDIVSLTHLKH